MPFEVRLLTRELDSANQPSVIPFAIFTVLEQPKYALNPEYNCTPCAGAATETSASLDLGPENGSAGAETGLAELQSSRIY
jgi:hypothetical protein